MYVGCKHSKIAYITLNKYLFMKKTIQKLRQLVKVSQSYHICCTSGSVTVDITASDGTKLSWWTVETIAAT